MDRMGLHTVTTACTYRQTPEIVCPLSFSAWLPWIRRTVSAPVLGPKVCCRDHYSEGGDIRNLFGSTDSPVCEVQGFTSVKSCSATPTPHQNIHLQHVVISPMLNARYSALSTSRAHSVLHEIRALQSRRPPSLNSSLHRSPCTVYRFIQCSRFGHSEEKRVDQTEVIMSPERVFELYGERRGEYTGHKVEFRAK